MSDTKWFVSEDLGVYSYDPELQQEHYPNDFPNVFDTELEAEDWAEHFEPDNDCPECGEPDGHHDRCCRIGYEQWCARVDRSYGQD